MLASIAQQSDNSIDPELLGLVQQSFVILEIYREKVGSKLACVGPDSVQGFDSAAQRIKTEIDCQHEERAICFFGSLLVSRISIVSD